LECRKYLRKKLTVVTHTYNPTTAEMEMEKIMVQGQAGKNGSKTSFQHTKLPMEQAYLGESWSKLVQAKMRNPIQKTSEAKKVRVIAQPG
jgi:L,D-peptidoglycan transpeptidase YkuD (ErfK/YbiS/YcfS/YnhG family)